MRVLTVVAERGVAVLIAASAAAACASRGGSSAQAPGGRDGGDAAVAGARRTDAATTTPSGAAPPYVLASLDGEGHVRGAGEIEITVEWPNPDAALLRAPAVNPCGTRRAPPVSVHTLHGVRDVVVCLESVARGRAPDPPRAVELAVRECRLEPPVLVAARLGSPLALINDDERRHVVLLEYLDADSPEPIARIPLPLVGQRFEVALDHPGIVRATVAADRKAHSYVYVPAHPYVGITDDRGRVRFADVVPGTYEVVAWHRPFERDGEPRTAAKTVTAVAAKKTEITLSLAP